MSKICPCCKIDKPAGDFVFRSDRKSLASYCKVCQAAASKKHYENNKAKVKARAIAHNKITSKKLRQYLWDYKKEHPCVDCGESDPIVLEFDHIDRSTKLYDVSTMVRHCFSMARVLEEIKKCAVRCANCHRRKTRREDLGCADLIGK